MSWRTRRDEVATDAQLQALRRFAKQYGWASWRIDVMTRGEASHAVDVARRKRDRGEADR